MAKQRLRHIEAERLGGFQIDEQLGCSTGRSAVDQVRLVWSIGNQTSRLDELPKAVHRRHLCAERQGMDADPVAGYERV